MPAAGAIVLGMLQFFGLTVLITEENDGAICGRVVTQKPTFSPTAQPTINLNNSIEPPPAPTFLRENIINSTKNGN